MTGTPPPSPSDPAPGQPSPKKRSKAPWIIGGVAVFAALAVLGNVIGKDSDEEKKPTSAPSSTSAVSTAPVSQMPTTQSPVSTAPTTAVAQSDCRTMVPFSGTEDPTFETTALGVPLPQGANIVTGRVSTDSDEPGKVAIAIDLCGAPVTSADDLRPIATQFAKAYRTSTVGNQIFALYVSNYETFTMTDTSGEVKIKDPDFSAHLWNGKPSAAAEQQNWVVVTE